MARIKQFFNGLVSTISAGGTAKATRAGEKIMNLGVALDSNKKIERANNIIGKQWRKGAKEGADVFFAGRRANIIAARERTAGNSLDELDSTSKWLAKDGWKQNAASLFYSGETGQLSKARIAGVSAGLGLGAYGVLSDDD